MIQICDNRRSEEVKLKDVDINGFFLYDGVLCRRVELCNAMHYMEEGIPYEEVRYGRIDLFNRETWVTPIRDEQITVLIEDWG